MRRLMWKTTIRMTTSNANHKKLNRHDLNYTHVCTHPHINTHTHTHLCPQTKPSPRAIKKKKTVLNICLIELKKHLFRNLFEASQKLSTSKGIFFAQAQNMSTVSSCVRTEGTKGSTCIIKSVIIMTQSLKSDG